MDSASFGSFQWIAPSMHVEFATAEIFVEKVVGVLVDILKISALPLVHDDNSIIVDDRVETMSNCAD